MVEDEKHHRRGRHGWQLSEGDVRAW